MKHFAQKQHVVDLCLTLSRLGYFAGTGGNIMLRLDAGHVAVTPSAVDYHAMRPADVCVLRLSDLQQVDGDRAPSVEAGLHAGLLRARPDAGCSIHTHQPVASALALLGRAVPVPPRWQATLGPFLPMVGYAPSGTGWLAAKFARAVRSGTQAYLMRNHGILCCGRDSQAALQAVDDLEALARALLADRIAERAATATALADTAGSDALWRVHDVLQERDGSPPPHPPHATHQPLQPAPSREGLPAY